MAVHSVRVDASARVGYLHPAGVNDEAVNLSRDIGRIRTEFGC